MSLQASCTQKNEWSQNNISLDVSLGVIITQALARYSATKYYGKVRKGLLLLLGLLLVTFD